MLTALIDSVEQKKAQLDRVRPLSVAALAQLQKHYDIELTYTSNAIEGTTLTLRETAEVIEHGITVGGKSLRDHLEAVDHYEAVQWMRELAALATPIGESTVRELHRRIVARSQPPIAGIYGQLPRRIAGSPVVFPNPAKIPALMEEFGEWLQAAPLDPAAVFEAPGSKYAEQVAAILGALGCEVSIIDAVALAGMAPDGSQREAVKGWDAADASGEWQDLVALRKAAHGFANPFECGPAFVSYDAFTMDSEGLMTEVTKGRGESATVETVWIAAPFEILGLARDPHGRSWGKWLRWRDADGRVHVQHVADAALQGEPAALCAGLADAGLSINRNQQRAFANYLAGATVEGRVTLVNRTGWHSIGGQSVFVLPEETIGPRGAERVILDASATGPYGGRGTLADWQNGVGALSSGHALPVLAISAALAGPLLFLAGQEGGGIHIFGGSSQGKTTILQGAASVWGRGATPGYVRAWRATANGLEGAAASATDTGLILDELGVLEARDAQTAIYGLANGAGKARAARDGSLREPKSWRVLILSSGEIPIEAKLSEDRRKPRARQLVRMLDIPGDRGNGFGVFDHAGAGGDAGKLAKTFKHAAISAYGTAGPEFVRRIVAEGFDEIGEVARDMIASSRRLFRPVLTAK